MSWRRYARAAAPRLTARAGGGVPETPPQQDVDNAAPHHHLLLLGRPRPQAHGGVNGKGCLQKKTSLFGVFPYIITQQRLADDRYTSRLRDQSGGGGRLAVNAISCEKEKHQTNPLKSLLSAISNEEEFE